MGHFRELYHRHYAAVYAYAAACMPARLDAQELTGYAFDQLLQQLVSPTVSVVPRDDDSPRRELLDHVRAGAIARSYRASEALSPGFRAWTAAGAAWPIGEDDQLADAFLRLPSAARCLLWHLVVERDGPEVTALISGVPRRLLPGSCDQARSMLRQARTDLYLERLDRQECREAVARLGLSAAAPLDEGGAAHFRRCPKCRAVYEDVADLDTRLRERLPARLLGWWPGDTYLKTKASVTVPPLDPPFLQQQLSRSTAYSTPPPPTPRKRPASAALHSLHSLHLTSTLSLRSPRAARTALAAALFTAGLILGSITAPACTTQTTGTPPPKGICHPSHTLSGADGRLHATATSEGPRPRPREAAVYGDPATIRRILQETGDTWAVVGLSTNRNRAAYGVAEVLQRYGKRIVPVHPKAEPVHGEQGYPTLTAIPFPVDVVDVFVNSELAGAVADEAMAIGAKALWFQLGVIDETAYAKAREAGLDMVMDRCPAIEIPRLG